MTEVGEIHQVVLGTWKVPFAGYSEERLVEELSTAALRAILQYHRLSSPSEDRIKTELAMRTMTRAATK